MSLNKAKTDYNADYGHLANDLDNLLQTDNLMPDVILWLIDKYFSRKYHATDIIPVHYQNNYRRKIEIAIKNNNYAEIIKALQKAGKRLVTNSTSCWIWHKVFQIIQEG